MQVVMPHNLRVLLFCRACGQGQVTELWILQNVFVLLMLLFAAQQQVHI